MLQGIIPMCKDIATSYQLILEYALHLCVGLSYCLELGQILWINGTIHFQKNYRSDAFA